MEITDGQGSVVLNNGVEMPYLGLGVFQINDGDEVINAVKNAINFGYRHIDTASLYGNEIGVGRAVADCGVDRKDIFITSKVWNSDQGYETTLKAFDKTMEKLGFEYLDLYLIHWPVKGKYIETWKALVHLYEMGRVRAIGVSNFLIHHIEDIRKISEILPAVNQVEFHPYLVQQELIDFCRSNNIQFEAWSPLMQGQVLSNKIINQIAEKYGKSPAQIIIRWDLQKGVVTIPKSVNAERIKSNFQVFDFNLTQDEIITIDSLDKNERIGAHPDHFDF